MCPVFTQSITLPARMVSWVIGLTLLLNTGCHRQGYYPYPPQVPQASGYQVPPAMPSTFPSAANGSGPGSVFAGGQLTPQLVELQRRAQELDANNRQLTSQLAQMQQQASVYRERSDLLAKQLEDATRQNNQLLASAQQYAEQARNYEASMAARGGARLTANNSVGGSAAGIQIPGAQIIPDGNAIRVRIAADQIFAPGTMQLNPLATSMLDQFASIVVRQYPRQRIVVEGHADASNPINAYQVSGAQAQVVVDYLSQRAGLPAQQMVVVGHGANRPVGDNNTPAGRAENRRIELVITPEVY